MGELIRSADWSQSTIGKPADWPDSLKSALGICLNSGFPTAIYWGNNFILFYNDAWSGMVGNKHPLALGKPGAEVWPEIWNGLEAQFNSVLAKGESIRSDDAFFPMQRYGYTEECYFDYTLSPIIIADGSIGGVFNAVIETTYRVINERRSNVLYSLLKLDSTQSSTQGVKNITDVLESAKEDLPFCLLYAARDNKIDDIELTGIAGTPLNEVENISWPFREAQQLGKDFHVQNLSVYVKTAAVSCWGANCTEALVVPLKLSDTNTTGFLVAGISPRKKLDQGYRNFINSAAIKVVAAINKNYKCLQEQKNQRKIIESETRFRKIMDQAPVAMLVLRSAEMIVFNANKAMLAVLDKDETAIGKPILELLPKGESQQIKEILHSVYQQGGSNYLSDMPVRLYRKGQLEHAYFDFSYSPLIEEGEITGVLVVATDVSERAKARQDLADSENLFRGITAASPTALWITDTDGNITYVNETWIKWTGKPLEKHLRTGWLDSICEDDVKIAYSVFVEDFINKRYHESNFRIVHLSGQERWVVCTGNPQFDSQQVFKGFIGACVDITAQRQLQQQKDNFLGVASHELKTPVTSIKAYAQVLEMMFRREGDTKKADMLGKLDKQVNRLNNLIADLLDVTKIHTGKMQFNETRFDFNQLVEDVIEDVQLTSSKHIIQKQLNFKGTALGDVERISQVFTNLLTNAIKYSPNANHIIVFTEQKDTSVQVCVQDFGIGISQHKKDMVFEQFYRVSGTTQHTFPGLGLGLYISSEIVKRLKGRIWVNSVEGKGSTFCFSFPFKS